MCVATAIHSLVHTDFVQSLCGWPLTVQTSWRHDVVVAMVHNFTMIVISKFLVQLVFSSMYAEGV